MAVVSSVAGEQACETRLATISRTPSPGAAVIASPCSGRPRRLRRRLHASVPTRLPLRLSLTRSIPVNCSSPTSGMVSPVPAFTVKSPISVFVLPREGVAPLCVVTHPVAIAFAPSTITPPARLQTQTTRQRKGPPSWDPDFQLASGRDVTKPDDTRPLTASARNGRTQLYGLLRPRLGVGMVGC